ncbi:T9SS type A sorting domain-containing protein [Neolewinella lacunae]|uniref:T9SS type A sorting domain-containing protein n=1 Tax=Neolewinella lacunae TaxID=1517758 RepID=A0A923T7Y7_9BACT|nr:T9SS type A sorting domain-containing protein [Neolewinella lacunae]MBC6994029.1 T9SS type A sorting domain-containing protein [Neolewinella lacunae]MDN3634699.1 T9SS type A sorting domain-containing protein [Neolewinella lacunae]
MRGNVPNILVVCSWVFFGVTLFAQNTFINKYAFDVQYGDAARKIIQVPDGMAFFNSTFLVDQEHSDRGGLVRLDEDGVVVYARNWDFPEGRVGISFKESMILHRDTIILAANHVNEVHFSNNTIIFAELETGTERVLRFSDEQPYYVGDLFLLSEDKLVLSSQRPKVEPKSFPSTIRWLELNGSEFRRINYFDDFSRVASERMAKDINDQFYIPSLGCKGASNCYPHQAWLSKIDPTGQLVWQKNYGRTAGNQVVWPQVAVANDSTIAFAWTRDTNDWDVQESPPVIYMLDTLGNKRDSFTFHGNLRTLNTLRATSNGDLLGCGVAWTDIGWCGWMFRMSSKAELIWERYIQDHRTAEEDNVKTELFDVTEFTDGSIAGAGYIIELRPEGRNSLEAWIVKLDANGCLDPGCTSDTIHLQQPVAVQETDPANGENDFKLWPNPTRDWLNLEISLTGLPAGEYAYEVMSPAGRIILQSKRSSEREQIDVRALPPGLYFLNLLKNGRRLGSKKFVKTP